MKLYEFIYNDNKNKPESEVLETLKIHLADEASLQGWAPGYNFRQRLPVKQLANGEKEYYFVVEGDVVAESPAGDHNSEGQAGALPKRDVAASP